MKLAFALALPFPLLLATAAAPPAPSPTVLIEAEHAFAADAAASGVRAAFLKWLSPHGVAFRPGPVDGQAAFSAMAPSPARLSWRPEVAAISKGGDLGWTTGPWSWRADSAQAGDTAWGEYVTVWRRTGEGRYRAVLDAGISHARPAGPPADPVFLEPGNAPQTGRHRLKPRRSLWRADADFGRIAKADGVAVALERYGSERLMLLRDDLPRVTGLAAACDTARSREGGATLMSLAQFVSRSGDLGYTYGSFVSGDSADPDSAWYVHVWQRGRTKPWELVLELVNPVPKRKS